MIASYNTDVATYDQYKFRDNAEKQSWAEQAKIRVNRTGNSYNYKSQYQNYQKRENNFYQFR